MASVVTTLSYINGFCCTKPSFGFVSYPSSSSQQKKRMVVVKAETINPEIRKTEEKVVDSVVVTELSKNITPYCRFIYSLYFFIMLTFLLLICNVELL